MIDEKTTKKEITEKVKCLNTTLSFELAHHKVEIKDLTEVNGHDDSTAYSAVVFVDGEKTATLFNDGWGGETIVKPIDAVSSMLVEILNKNAKAVIFSKIHDLNFSSLGEICDTIVENHLLLKSLKKTYRENNHLFITNPFTCQTRILPMAQSITILEEEDGNALVAYIKNRLNENEILVNSNVPSISEYIISY